MPERQTAWRERKKQMTRRALADAATRLFAERGYEETTIPDLAEAAHISPRTFFSYFRSKEDVLFADLDQRIAALGELELRQAGEPLRDGIRRVAGQLVDSVIGEPAGDAAAARLAIIGSRPSLQAAALLRQAAAQRLLADRLHAAYADELDEVAAAAVVGAFTSALRAAATRPGARDTSRDAQSVIDQVRQLLEHGLGSPRPT